MSGSNLDGPTLRAVRESIGVPLRRIARQAGMSHGHLSKVERGEHGRPVTPAIMAAYERITGIRLAEAAVDVAARRDRDTGRRGQSWRPGQMTVMRRQAFNAAVGAIAIGGHLGEPTSRLIDSTGRPVTPTPPELVDVDQLAYVTGLLTDLDLRYGGGLISQVAKALLRWAVVMLDAAGMTDPAPARLQATVSVLAHRAGWAAFDVAGHEAARSLFRLALYTATRSGEPDLRGHVLADIAAQHNRLGYHRDALDVVRLAEGDERIAPPVRMVLHGVKARTYAALGEPDDCRRHIDRAERESSHADAAEPGWLGRIAGPAALAATTGHALAQLAGHTGQLAHQTEAADRLVAAIAGLDPTSHARARALCQARLAALRLRAGDLAGATGPAGQALQAVEQVRSARLTHAIVELRDTAAGHPDRAEATSLIESIDAGIGPPGEDPAVLGSHQQA